MSKPKWQNDLTPECNSLNENYAKKLCNEVNRCASRSELFSELEPAADRYERFLEFGRRIVSLQNSGFDPKDELSKTLDESGGEIPDFFGLIEPPWYCYYYRDARDADHPRGIGFLLFHVDDKPENLANALTSAAAAWRT